MLKPIIKRSIFILSAIAILGVGALGVQALGNIKMKPSATAKIKIVNQQNTTSTSNNPVGWWKMDEGTGQYAYDASGNGNTGTLGTSTNAEPADPTWTTGKLGKGLSFDGVNDYVRVGNQQTFNLSAYTVSVWFKTGISSNMDIYTDGGTNNSYGEFYMGSTGRVGAYFGGGAGGTFSILTDDAYNNNAWHHAVLVQKSKSSRDIYIDGVLKKSNSSTISSNIFNYSTIGALYRNSAMYYFNGLIDDVRIFSRALSSQEVAQFYNSTKNGYLGNIKMHPNP